MQYVTCTGQLSPTIPFSSTVGKLTSIEEETEGIIPKPSDYSFSWASVVL